MPRPIRGCQRAIAPPIRRRSLCSRPDGDARRTGSGRNSGHDGGMTERIEPFRIAVPQEDLDELHRRLDAARWPDELPGAGWDYGVASDHLRELAGYWRSGYDWRAHERRLNELPQFTTEIDGQRVHFAHRRSSRPDAVPVLLSHGWPST